jgi:hypothetical protein
MCAVGSVKVLVAILVLCVSVLPLYAQWVPLTAKITESKSTLDASGNVIDQQTREGYFFRSSNGSELTQWLGPNGSPGSGILLDTTSKARYKINYVSKTCAGEGKYVPLPQPPLDKSRAPTQNIIREDVVAGMGCTVQPNISKSTDMDGEVCFSFQYGLVLRSKLTQTDRKTGLSAHYKRELSDIKLNVASNHQLFDVSQYSGCGR